MIGKEWIVLKFGGTSVASKSCWDTILKIVEERVQEGLRPMVVCSAVASVSDMLEEILDRKDIFSAIKERHISLAKELNVDNSEILTLLEALNAIVGKITSTAEVTPKLRAQVLSFGELLLTKLGAAYLISKGITTLWQDARSQLHAEPGANDSHSYLSADCEFAPDEKLIGEWGKIKDSVIVTQGFIAANSVHETVLLGRGGSDVSASYFAAKLKAIRCEIWTDVPGMYTADPRKVSSARLLTRLNYDEAQEIALFGGKVLHPRSIGPVQKYKIPLHIRSVQHPEIGGTVISVEALRENAEVKAISSRLGVTLISMETLSMWHRSGFLSDIFSCFKSHHLSVDLVSTSESSVTVSLDGKVNHLNEQVLERLVTDLGAFCKVDVIRPTALVSIIGRNIRSIIHKLSSVMEVFNEQKIYLITQAANDLNFTFVVDEEQSERLVRQIHDELFKVGSRRPDLGATWQELFAGKKDGTLDMWWLEKRDELLALSKKKTPVYVYDSATIDNRLNGLRSISAVDRFFYSIKANNNIDVLKKVHSKGFGFEAVSIGEVDHIFSVFPDIEPERILFTPNFAPKSEYEKGFEKGIFVTLDNLYPLEFWPEVFKGRDIFVRVDPGAGDGHHKYVRTAGSRSKFGVSLSDIEKLIQLSKELSFNIVGLHAHVGSNILRADTWSELSSILFQIADDLPNLKYIDLGGGLGVVERAGQTALDLKKVNELLEQAKAGRKNIEFWMEPGRFVVAEAGVLLAKVTQTKTKGENFYIGLDVGMNSLIRPALYGAHHEIINLSKIGSADEVNATIVGPICESGDVLGLERSVAKPDCGDTFLIATAGAYGRVMSSSYNLRAPADEFFLKL